MDRAFAQAADHAQQRDGRAERGDVGSGVGRATGSGHFARLAHNGHRGFGRNARHRSVNVAVEHDVAGDQQTGGREALEQTGVR